MWLRYTKQTVRSLLLFAVFYLTHLNSDVFFNQVELKEEAAIRHYADVVLQLLMWLCVAQVLKVIINYTFERRYANVQTDNNAPRLLKDLLVLLAYFIVFLCILRIVFQQPITGIWITSGAVALTVGMALRNIILDLFSGIAVNIEKPYRIGDWIEIHQRFANESVIGQVTDINWRATHIRTEQNTNVVIPNHLMTTMAMTTNYWHGTKPTRYEVNITLDFSIPSARAKRILTAGITEAVSEKGFVKEKDSQVLIDCANELGVVYKIRYWITPWSGISPSIARDRVLFSLLKHLDASGITPAYPKEDVYHENMPSRQLDTNKAEDRSKLLSRIDIFSVLTADELILLSSRMQKRIFEKGETIVRQDDDGESMFILFEGLLDVIIKQEETEVHVATLSPPEYFGEMSLLTGEKRTGTIVCLTDAVVYEIGHQEFTELLIQREEIIEQIARRISARINMNNRLIEEERKQRSRGEEDIMRHSLIYRIRNFFTGALQNP